MPTSHSTLCRVYKNIRLEAERLIPRLAEGTYARTNNVAEMQLERLITAAIRLNCGLTIVSKNNVSRNVQLTVDSWTETSHESQSNRN